jgi:hypothetical protein
VQAITRVPLSLYLVIIWVLGWSTRHLALDPSSVLYLQHRLCSYLDALQHLPPPQPVPRQLLPLRYIQLTQPRLYTLHAAPPCVPLLPLRPPQLRPTRTRRSRRRCRHSPGSPLPVCGMAEQGPTLCTVLGAAVALWCSGSIGALSALPLAVWALVVAVPPAVGVAAVVVAAAAPSTTSSLRARKRRTGCSRNSGHTHTANQQGKSAIE